MCRVVLDLGVLTIVQANHKARLNRGTTTTLKYRTKTWLLASSPDLKPLAGNYKMACALRAATERTSIMLTIIAALEAVFLDLATKISLYLHLIGVSTGELDVLMLFEEVLHLLPAVKSVDCSSVRIERPRPIHNNEWLTLDCCEDCTSAGRTRSIYM
jgi:mitochondrial splicing suppressor protein 51